MTTVDGYGASSEYVAYIISTEIGEEDRSDPTLLYLRATQLKARHDAVNAELEKLRGLACARMNDGGMSYRAIAEHVGISSARVQQLINKAREKGEERC